MKEFIAEVIVNDYVREIVVSGSIRAKFYKKGKAELLLKFCDKTIYKETNKRVLTEDYEFLKLKKDKFFYLYDKRTMTRVVANESKIGQQRTKVINGQDLYRLTLPDYEAGKIKAKIKEQLVPIVNKLDKIEHQPIIIDVELRDTFNDMFITTNPNWDIDNRLLFYRKVFNDVLSGSPMIDKTKKLVKMSKEIIKNDHRGFVSGGSELFTPIERHETRQLIFRIYKDLRPCVSNFRYLTEAEGEAPLRPLIIKKRNLMILI